MTMQSTAARRVGFWLRLVAELIDWAAAWAGLLAGAGIAWAVLLALGAAWETAGPWGAPTGLAAWAAYWIVLHAHGRATLGKLAIGAVVVRADDGGPIGYGRSAGRLAAELLSALPFNLGYLWVAWDPDKRGFHDLLAGTLVVRREDFRGEQRLAGPR